MKHDRPSSTARRVAVLRAAHQIFDSPRVLEDPVALRLLGPSAEARIRASERRLRSGFAEALRVALGGEPWRTWFAPDELARELRDMGFTRIEDLDNPALNSRFFAGRMKHLGERSVGRVMTAWR